MDKNTLYYFFSTTAQTLAAAVGFLAAFVLLRLQDWDSRIAEANVAFQKMGASPEVKALYEQCDKGDEEAVRKFLGDRNISIGSAVVGLHPAALTLTELLPARRKMIARLWAALGMAGITAAVALGLIPAAAYLPDRSALAWGVVSVVFLAVLVCGLKFVEVIRAALRPHRPQAF